MSQATRAQAVADVLHQDGHSIDGLDLLDALASAGYGLFRSSEASTAYLAAIVSEDRCPGCGRINDPDAADP